MKFKYLKIVISLLIISILFYSFNGISLYVIASKISFKYLLEIIFLLFFSIWIRAYRWQILMNDDGIQKISIYYSLKLLFIGQALNIVMPSGAGDVAKSYFGYKNTGIKERMFSVSLYDKIIAIASVGFLAVFSTLYSGKWFYIILAAISLAPLTAIILFPYFSSVIFFNRIFQWLNAKITSINVFEVIDHLKFSFKAIFFSTFLSLVAWIVTYQLLYLSFISFGLEINLWDVMMYSPILTLARLFPLTLNGLGSDELLMVYIFSNSGINDKSIILISSLYYRLIMILLPALPGIFYMLKKEQETKP